MKTILKSKGEHRRRFTKIFKMARTAFLNEKTPSYEDLFEGNGAYSKKSIGIQCSMLKKLGIVGDSGLFTDQFFREYVKLHDAQKATKNKFACIKNDVVLNPDITIDTSFDYTHTMATIRKNPTDITYHFPDCLRNTAQKIEYGNTGGIQVIKLNHVGGSYISLQMHLW